MRARGLSHELTGCDVSMWGTHKIHTETIANVLHA
jgi:hypothetical protein